MAYSSAYEICNLALAKVGNKAITSAQFTTPGTNEAARYCVAFYTPERDLLLESFPWKFAIRRVIYDVDDYDNATITSITAANPAVLTSTAHGLASGYEQGVYLWDTGEEDYDNEIFSIVYVDADSFQLRKQDKATAIDGTSIGAVATGYWRMAPLDEYTYLFSLPSDILRIQRLISATSDYKREGTYILTDDDVVSIEYIASITTVSVYDPSFVNALAVKLAAELAGSLAGKDKMKTLFLEEFHKIAIPHAYRMGAIEGRPKDKGEVSTSLTSWQQAGR